MDDDPIARRLMTVVLSRESYRLAFANNGPEALEKASKLTPDLILLDVMMPDMNGFEVCQRLRADPLLAEVPIIMVTALENRASRARGIEVGADDFISKPFDQAELRARVRTITRLNRYRLLLERAKFEQIIQVSPDGLLLVDADDVIQLVNPSLCRLLDSDEDDLINQEIATFIKPQHRDRCLAYFHQAIAGHAQSPTIEVEFLQKSGETFPVEISAAPFAWREESAAQVIIRDITERKQAEEALRRYAEEQTALYTIASVAASELEPDNLLTAVLDVILAALNADAGWITRPRFAPNQVSCIAAWQGVPESFVEEQEYRPLPTVPETLSPNLISSQLDTECLRFSSGKLEEIGLRSHISIPLSSANRTLGYLHIAWQTDHPRSESDFALLQTIGQQVGLALHNAQLYQKTRQVDRLQAINDLDRVLATTLDLQKVAEVALIQLGKALNTPNNFLLLHPFSTKGHSAHVFIPNQGWREISLTEENADRLSLLLQRLRRDRSIPIAGSELPVTDETNDLIHDLGPYGIVAVAWGEDHLAAIFAFGGHAIEHPFIDEDQALINAAMSRTGQAIRNAQLYQASQQQSTRLATLNAVSSAAVSSLELDSVLRQALDLTCQAIGATIGSVLLRDKDTDELVFVIGQTEESIALRGERLAPGQGIAGWVIEHQQSVYVNDVRQDPRWYSGIDEITGIQTRSLMCAPLKHRDKITGVIEIINKDTGKFNEHDLSLLEAVSSIVASAMENARLFTNIKTRANELALLNEIGMMLTSTLNYDTVVHAALSQTRRLFFAEFVALLQPDAQTGHLRFVKALASNKEIQVKTQLATEEGIGGWIMAHRQSLLLEDAQADARFQNWVGQHTDLPARAMMAAPLLAHDRLIGVIEVISSEIGIYTREDLQTLQSLAATLAVALENAGLYDELRSLLREREQAQAQLIHAEKMTALGRLAASITHEINNPLQAVLSYLTLTQEELQSTGDRARMTRYLDTVGSELERIAAIVRRMRDFYRPAGEGFKSTNIHNVLESVLDLTYKQLQHSNVKIVREWDQALPTLQANPDHLKQVFLNLVLNAIDAMPEGGVLHIATSLDQIQIEGETDSPCSVARITFSDTGEGISPHILSHLFEPFFTTKERGTGLGLSISYGIIKAHNGDIKVESHAGMGTTFTVLLPIEQTQAK